MSTGQFVFWAAALVGHGAFWVEIVNRLHGLGWHRRLIDNVTLLCGAAVTGLPLAIAAAWATASGPTPAWATAYAGFSLVVLVIWLATRVGLHWDPRRDRRSKQTERHTLNLAERLGRGATGGPRIGRLARLPGNRVLRVAVEHHDVPIERLPAGLDGLRVAHLTDLHMSGRLSVDYFREVVRAVNEWGPDLVCVTGDLVEHTPQLEWVEPTLGGLRPPLGAYFVLGNHDAQVDCAELRRRLSDSGLTDVAGRTLQTVHNGEAIRVCGDERPWFPNGPTLPDPEGPEPAAFTLCLAHTPDRFGWAVRQGVDLVLAGHTHGGQVCFPVLGPLLCPSRHSVRYASGTFRRGHTVMHVGRGTGSLFPLRYGCPPEIALLTLRRDRP